MNDQDEWKQREAVLSETKKEAVSSYKERLRAKIAELRDKPQVNVVQWRSYVECLELLDTTE